MAKLFKFVSLRTKLVIVMLVALIVAAAVFAGVRELGSFLVWRYYLDEADRQERADGYVEDFQNYVTQNKLSVKDTAKISSWDAGSYVDMIIYKDSTLFYAPEWFKDFNGDGEDDSTSKPDGEDMNGENMGGEGEAKPEGGDAIPDEIGSAEDNEVSEMLDPETVETEVSASSESAESEQDSSESAEPVSSSSVAESEGNGVAGDGEETTAETETESETLSSTETEEFVDKGWFSGDRGFVQYLTEEARDTYLNRVEDILSGNNALTPIYFVDGTLFVMVVDYTEEFLNNVVFAVSIVSALLVLVVIMLINFTNTTLRIKRLAHNVKLVERGELSRPIKVEGNDEITALAGDVNSMRNSVVDNMTKERQAWEANAGLITAMSHDIRTPLTVLLGYLDLAELQNSDPVNAEYLAACKENALRLKSLSDDMFSYFLVFGQKDILPETLEAQEIEPFEHMISEHRMLLEENGYTFVYEGEIPRIKIIADTVFLSRVIDNVFSNIAKYADPAYPVTMRAETYGGFLKISIANKIKKDDSRPESNHIGIKTCVRIMEKMNGGFETAADEDTFKATVTIPAVTD